MHYLVGDIVFAIVIVMMASCMNHGPEHRRYKVPQKWMDKYGRKQ